MDSLSTIARRIDKKPFLDHSWITDLIYYEGPIVSLYKGSQDQDFFYYWCEHTELINRWLVIPVTRQEITDYVNVEKTLFSLVAKQAALTLVDTANDGEIVLAHALRLESLPEKYMPPEDSYFDVDLCPSDAYKQLITSLYVIDIDKRWFFDEFSEVEKLFTQLYSFMYAMNNVGGIVSTSRVQHAFENYPWRGGFSAVNFYKDLRASVPSFHEPEVESIAYASPGTIKLELYAPVAEETGEILNNLFKNSVAAKEAYDEAKKFLKFAGLLKIDSEANYENLLTEATIISIHGHLDDLSRVMGIERLVKEILELSNNPLVAIKIVLSFYRRASKLNHFQFDGKLRFNRFSQR